jgi:hypothetical protein
VVDAPKVRVVCRPPGKGIHMTTTPIMAAVALIVASASALHLASAQQSEVKRR